MEIPEPLWNELLAEVRGARLQAQAAALSAASTSQTVKEVVVPALQKVEFHEVAIQRTQGALWAIGVVAGGLSLLAVLVSAWAAFA